MKRLPRLTRILTITLLGLFYSIIARAADDSLSGNNSSSGLVQADTTAVNPVNATSAFSPSNRLLLSADTNTGIDFQSQQTGRFPVQFGAALGGYYDDNIYTQKTNKQSDLIFTITPFVSWNSASESGAENSFQLYYAPTYEAFLNKSNNDTFDQYAKLGFSHNGEKTSFSVTQSFVDSSNSTFDVADRVNHQDYETDAALNYQLTGKTSLEVKAQQDLSVYDQGFDSSDWNLSSYLNYQILPKVSVGLGGLIGYADISGPNQTYEQANFQATYVPTAKTSVYVVAGAEFRQTQHSNADQLTPDFSLGANWQPFDGTNLNLNASRSFDYSNKFSSTDYINTGASLSLTQRFIQQVTGTLSLAYVNAAYQDNDTGSSTGLNYDYYTVKPSVAYQPVEWFTLDLFYQYRENVSNSVNAFQDNQVGFNATFQY